MKPSHYVSALLVSLALPAHAQLAWDPAGDQSNSGGGGTWNTSSLNWNDDGSAPNVAWTNGSAATFGGTGGTIAIATGAGISAGNLTFSNATGNYLFDAATAGEGISLSNGAIIDNTGASQQLRFALDTILSTASGNTITLRPGTGGIQFAQGTNGARNNLFSVAGATLNVDTAGVVRGTINDVGQFSSVSMVGGSTFFQERNSGGSVTFANDWSLGTGNVTFDRNFANNNGAYQLSGAVSGLGKMIVNVGGGGTGNLLILANTNSYQGGTEITDDSRLRLTGSGSLGSGAVDLGTSGILEIQRETGTIANDISGSGSVSLATSSQVITLTGSNSYSGATTVATTDVVLGSAGALSSNSNLVFNGNATLTTNADFNRALGTGAGQVQWTNGGGFGAVGANHTINIGGAGATLSWGDTNFLANSGFALFLGTSSSTHTAIFANGLGLTSSGQNYSIRAFNGAAAIDGRVDGVVSGDGGLRIRDGGTIEIASASNYTGTTTVENSATLVISGNSSAATGAATVASAATLLVNGTLGSATIAANGTLGGSGIIDGAVTVSSTGTLAPGNSAGILTINNTLDLGGTLSMEINGLTAGSLHDQVVLNGSGVFGGVLSLAWDLLAPSALNTELVLINNDGAELFTGAFSNAADLSSVNDNLGNPWQLRYSGGTGNDLTLVAIPEPRAAVLGLLGALALLRRRR
jgi:fibronectin-binding autotransporter adhesin